MRLVRFTLVLLLPLLHVTGLSAASTDPDWPCIQRKVPKISPLQMWQGPEITDEIRALAKDPAIEALASQLARRRIGMDEAEKLIADFAAGLGDDRNRKLTALFARTFDLISSERDSVMAGITRFAHKQQALSRSIEEVRQEAEKIRSAEPPDLDKLEEIEDKLAWDERIFRERMQSLRYVCETPVLLEKRLYAIAQAIQKHLEN